MIKDISRQIYHAARLSLQSISGGLYKAVDSCLSYSPAFALAEGKREMNGLNIYDLSSIASYMGGHGVKSKAQQGDNWNKGQKGGKKKRQDGPHVHVNKYASESQAAKEQARFLAGDTPAVRAQEEKARREAKAAYVIPSSLRHEMTFEERIADRVRQDRERRTITWW